MSQLGLIELAVGTAYTFIFEFPYLFLLFVWLKDLPVAACTLITLSTFDIIANTLMHIAGHFQKHFFF